MAKWQIVIFRTLGLRTGQSAAMTHCPWEGLLQTRQGEVMICHGVRQALNIHDLSWRGTSAELFMICHGVRQALNYS